MGEPTYTVTHERGSEWRVRCSCGHLDIAAPEAEVGMLARIHRDVAHNGSNVESK